MGNTTRPSNAWQIWALALSVFTMHCKQSSVAAVRVSRVHTDGFAANIYWDLGGDDTQYGSPEAIGKLVVLQFKVFPLLRDGNPIAAKASTGSDRRPSHLGGRCDLHTRFGPRPLHSHIPHEIFPHDLLCGTWDERGIWRSHHPWRMSNLPATLVQLGSLNTRWLLWRSKIAGSLHWHLQSHHGRDCGGAAHARAMGFANGHG